MKLGVAALAAGILASASAFAQTGRYQDIVDVCANSGDPTATPEYCTCSAEKLVALSDMDQLLLVEFTKWMLATPQPTDADVQALAVDLKSRTGLATDEEYQQHMTTVGNAATAADQACMKGPAPAQ